MRAKWAEMKRKPKLASVTQHFDAYIYDELRCVLLLAW